METLNLRLTTFYVWNISHRTLKPCEWFVGIVDNTWNRYYQWNRRLEDLHVRMWTGPQRFISLRNKTRFKLKNNLQNKLEITRNGWI